MCTMLGLIVEPKPGLCTSGCGPLPDTVTFELLEKSLRD